MEDNMIPQEKSAAVTRGLREVFGVSEFEDIRMMTKGRTSALVFRIVVRGKPYLLRIIMREDSTTARHFACMRAAAEAGLAPRVWYSSMEDRISITDFVEAVPFQEAEALVRMPTVLRALHALPPFPTVVNHLNTTCMFLLNKGPALDGFLQMIRSANLLPKDASEELFARYADVAAVYSHQDADMVSCHNDFFKPDNILFDGDRVWLVDWEAAFRNDRYAELAVVANLFVSNDAEERTYLQGYFGQPPDEYQRARFFLMQQVAHIFYSLAFLLQGSPGKPVDLSEPAPTYGDFHRQFWSGEVKLTDSPTKTAYGRVHLERLLQDTRQARFNKSLKIVSDCLAQA
jgi:aminoglycoside phosphotransferase (APT) family kinase protein